MVFSLLPKQASRLYSFADKQEREPGVVQKFPYGNFFLLRYKNRYKKPRYTLTFYEFAKQILFNALPRVMIKLVQYRLFDKLKRPSFDGRFELHY